MRLCAVMSLIAVASALTACGGGSDEPSGTATPAATPSTLVIENGTTYETAGADVITAINADIPAQAFGSEVLGTTAVGTDRATLSLSYLQSNPAKFIVGGMTQRDGGYFGCISSAWTSDEKAALRTAWKLKADLTPCPSSVSFNVTTRALKLDHTALPTLQLPDLPIPSSSVLILSADRVMDAPSFDVPTSGTVEVTSPDMPSSPAGDPPAATPPAAS